MKRIWLLLVIFLAVGSHYRAHAVACNLSATASTATIQAAANAMAAGTCTGTANGYTMLFPAGPTNISGTITIPCSSGAMQVLGATVAWPGPYTSLITSSVSGGVPFAYTGGCPAGSLAFHYLNFNGMQPTAGGGGFLYLPANSQNVTVTYNNLHGNQANPGGSHEYDTMIWIDGDANSGSAGNALASNIVIDWNQMGGSGDCSGVNSLFSYQGGNYDYYGGYCTGVGIYTAGSNIDISYNSIGPQEQGIKCFQQPGNLSASNRFAQNNLTIRDNDIHDYHRIAIECQHTAQPNVEVLDNDTYNNVNPGYGNQAFSLPLCCGGGSPGVLQDTDCDNNLAIANNPATAAGSGGYVPNAFEFWSQGTCDNNTIQGYFANGVVWGFGLAPWDISNNLIQLSLSGSTYFNDQQGSTPAPTFNNNTTGNLVSAQTSAAPTISPTPTGTYTGIVTVTITDAGVTNSGVGAQGNTTVYYTTDGSTPTFSSTVCNVPPATSCTFSVPAGSTVNAFGMWGAPNQPHSYPSNYGFVPSMVVGAYYSTGSAPTLAGVTLTQETGSGVQVGSTAQMCATMSYTSPTTTNTVCGSGPDTYGTTPTGWTSSSPSVATINGSGTALGVAAGSTNLTVSAGPFTSPTFPLTVSAAPANVLGNNQADTSGSASSGTQVSTYAVTGSAAGGYDVARGTICLIGSHAAGYQWDLILTPGTPTTQSSTAACHGTYTTTGTSADAACQVVAMVGCGVLPVNSGYWIGENTNEPGAPGLSFYDCGDNVTGCTGSAPTTGVGTYPYQTVAVPYGSYSGMLTAMTPAGSPGYQGAAYVVLTNPLPVLAGGYLTSQGGQNVLGVGATLQLSAYCTYTSAAYLCSPNRDKYGDKVIAWISSNPSIATVEDVGSANPGLVSAMAMGAVNITARLTGGTIYTLPFALTVGVASPLVASSAQASPLGSVIGRNGNTNWLYVPVDSYGRIIMAGALGAVGYPRIASTNLVGPNGAWVGLNSAVRKWYYVPTDAAGDLLAHFH